MKLKLKRESHRQFITTQSGVVITKEEFTEVDRFHPEIVKLLECRNDLEIKEDKPAPAKKPVKAPAEKKVTKKAPAKKKSPKAKKK